MINKYKVKLGYLPMDRPCMSTEYAKKSALKVKEWLKNNDIDFVDIDGITPTGMASYPLEAEAIAEHFIANKVDALFLMHANFGDEGVVARVAKRVGKPVLVWGERDGYPDENGFRQRDSQCGMFATTKALKRLGIPFTYITNSELESEIFKDGINNFISAAAVVKAMDKPRIGQIGPRPLEFWSVMCSEGELLEKFGIEIVPITITELINRTFDTKKNKAADVADVVHAIKSRPWKFHKVDDDQLGTLAALKIAVANWAEEQQISALGLQCWVSLSAELKLCNCMMNGELAADGLPVGCEMDIHGAISSLMLQAVSQGKDPVFFADLTVRHPENDNAELLWHCGNFPYTLADDNENNCMRPHHDMQIPGTAGFELVKKPITVARFDGARGEYSLLMGHGHGVEGPFNCGTYTWMEVNDWPLWEERLMYGPYIHHCAGVFGHHAAALYEACKYIPELKTDAVEPSEEEIRCAIRNGKTGVL